MGVAEILGVINLLLIVAVMVKLFMNSRVKVDTDGIVSSVKDGLSSSQRELREELSGSIQSATRAMGDNIMSVQKTIGESQTEKLAQMKSDINANAESMRQIVGPDLQNSIQGTLNEKFTQMGKSLSDAQQHAGELQHSTLTAMDEKIGESLSSMSKSLSDSSNKLNGDVTSKLEALEKRLSGFETSITAMMKTMSDTMTSYLSTMSKNISDNQSQTGKNVTEHLATLENRLKTLESSNNEKLEAIKNTVAEHLNSLSESNQKKLDSIQSMVSSKLESNLKESFNLVSERLEQVYKGLGEMQNVASGVGDLKKILSNVKTRGIMGEIQLGMILDEILAPEQYEREIPTIPGSTDHVEYAVRLPGPDGESTIYLPIDSKFPGDTFSMLQDAYDTGDSTRISEAKKQLEAVIKKCAKDIRQKYVEPPHTTNFGIMFLPFEGLYAEVVNSGLTGVLQQEYNVTVAGPSTMAAMLNSLQMGFRTLAIQKRSNEVWKILGETKGEFMKFEKALKSVQDRISKTGEELENLIGRRTRAINRKLRSVEVLEGSGTEDTPLLTDQESDDED